MSLTSPLFLKSGVTTANFHSLGILNCKIDTLNRWVRRGVRNLSIIYYFSWYICDSSYKTYKIQDCGLWSQIEIKRLVIDNFILIFHLFVSFVNEVCWTIMIRLIIRWTIIRSWSNYQTNLINQILGYSKIDY